VSQLTDCGIEYRHISNDKFNGPLSRTTQVSQKKQSLTHSQSMSIIYFS